MANHLHSRRQLRLYGYVARLFLQRIAPTESCCRDPRGRTMPREGTIALWLRQVESHLNDMRMADVCHAQTSAVCRGDGQTEAEGVPSQGGRSDALIRRKTPYLTWPGVRYIGV